MNTLLLTLLALISLLPVAVVQAGPVETPRAVGQVLQVAGTYLPLVARSKQDEWVLLKVEPDPLSGFATPGGGHISGRYTVVQSLGAAVTAQNGTYSWPWGASGASGPVGVVNAIHSRWLTSGLFAFPPPPDDQSPENLNRHLLCVLHEGAVGKDRFTNVHLVPTGWEEDVLPAVLYLRSHPEGGGAVPDLAGVQTRALLHNPNPYLVLAAVQTLAARMSLTTADVEAALSSTDQRVAAASLILVRFYGWADSGANAPANAQDLEVRVSKMKSLDQLEAAAVGILAARPQNVTFYPSSTADLPDLPNASTSPRLTRSALETQVIPAVRQRLKELAPNGTLADTRWRTIDSICRTFKS